MPDFDGKTFSPELDGDRLANWREKVFDFLSDHEWHTLSEIREGVGAGPDVAIPQRIYDLRKESNGNWEIESKRLPGREKSGVWLYRFTGRKNDWKQFNFDTNGQGVFI